MNLILKLDLGNDAAQTYKDLSRVMAKVSERLGRLGRDKPEDGDGATVVDENGNRIGRWEIRE